MADIDFNRWYFAARAKCDLMVAGHPDASLWLLRDLVTSAEDDNLIGVPEHFAYDIAARIAQGLPAVLERYADLDRDVIVRGFASARRLAMGFASREAAPRWWAEFTHVAAILANAIDTDHRRTELRAMAGGHSRLLMFMVAEITQPDEHATLH